VCVLTSVHNPFDQRVFYKEAVSLARAGYQVTLIGPGPESLAGVHHGVRLLPLPPPTTRRRRLLFQVRLLRAARTLAAHVYHLHDPELLPMGCVLRLLGHRVIYDVHENYPAVALTRAWIPQCLRRPLSHVVDVTERTMACLLSGVVGVIEEQRPRFRHCLFASVRNYPRLEWFAPAPSAAGAELVHVGSLSRDRGAHLLLEVMRQLRCSHPDVRLDTLGPFHTRAEEVAFHATVREFGLQEHVNCRTEYLPYDELGRFIGAHKIGLIPGQLSAKNLTPFVPTKLFEYLACGVPVVASSLPSIERLFEMGEWGILAAPDDPRAHAGAIAALLDDPGHARCLGTTGRQVVESLCNWETEAEKLLDLYHRLFDTVPTEEMVR
jgi:glycosyltransferase involved in cell wall biosynthesis